MLITLSRLGYILPPLVAALISAGLAITVLIRARPGPSKLLFKEMVAMLSVWNLAIFFMRASADPSLAVQFARLGSIFFTATFVVYYHFTVVYTERRRQWLPLVLAYSVLLVEILISPTNLIIEDIKTASYGYAPVVGNAGYIFSGVTFVLIFGGAYNLIRKQRLLISYEERNRVKYLLAAIIFPLAGALLDGFTDLPPMAVWFNIIFCAICTYAIVRYHLFDISVVIRKGLSYLVMSVLVAFPFVLLLALLESLLGDAFPVWGVVLIFVIMASIVMPFYIRIQGAVDRLFFREKYDYLKSIQQFSREVQSITELEELARTFTTLVSKALRTTGVSLFLAAGAGKNFHLVAEISGAAQQTDIFIPSDSLLIKWLALHHEPLDIDLILYSPVLLGLSTREKGILNSLQARLCVPLVTRQGILSGVLFLGPKKSEQAYSGEDRELVVSLCNSMAMAIANAFLFQESQRELAERKRAEESLRESEEKYRALVENAEDIIFMIDRDLKVLSINKSAGRFLGGRSEEYTGKSIADIFPPDVAANYSQSLTRVFETGAPFSIERTSVISGHEITFDTVLSPIRDSKGEIIAVIGVSRDVTERKEAEAREDALLQQLNLANRLATIGEMAAGIAHEINNPLTAVIGFADLLLKQEDLPADVKETVNIINTGAQRVADIVRGLLTFSRQGKPERSMTDVNSVLQTSLGLRTYFLKANDIELKTDFASSLPLIMADPGQLQQVFINLIMNAESAILSARRQPGHIHIKTEQRDKTVRVSITDDGIGISRADMPKLFHPFFTTREVGQGTGLGLSICHGIVTGHGGKIYADSAAGVGTTFFVELPLHPKESEWPPTKGPQDES